MVLKVILIIAAAFFLYVFFFKKNREKDIAKKNEMITDEMVECPSCGTYVSKNEAVMSNGNFYCSKECLTHKK